MVVKRIVNFTLPAVAVAIGGLTLALSAGATTASDVIAKINAERMANHLPPLHEDTRLSAGCAGPGRGFATSVGGAKRGLA